MESDDCSVPSEDEDGLGQDGRAECNDETSYVSQVIQQSRTPSRQISEDGQCSESEYRSIIPNKRMGGEYSSHCNSKSKSRDESVQQSSRVMGSNPPSECGSDSSGRTWSKLPSGTLNKPGSGPGDADLVCNNQMGDGGRSDIGNMGVLHRPPTESFSRVDSRTPSEPSCNISHGRDGGKKRDCLEDPLIKRKVRVGDLASLLASAQPKAG